MKKCFANVDAIIKVMLLPTMKSTYYWHKVKKIKKFNFMKFRYEVIGEKHVYGDPLFDEYDGPQEFINSLDGNNIYVSENDHEVYVKTRIKVFLMDDHEITYYYDTYDEALADYERLKSRINSIDI